MSEVKNEFTCKRCGYATTIKSNLKNHLTKKRVCEATHADDNREELVKELYGESKEKTLECACGKKYASRYGLTVHQKKCALCNPSNPNSTDGHVISDLMKEIDKLKEKIQVMECGGNTTTNNNTMNNTITIVMPPQASPIELNDFGKEDMSHITDGMLKRCLLQLNTGVKNLVNEMHFNPNVPQNCNIRFKSARNKTLEIFKDQQWIEANQSTILDELIRSGYKVLFTFFFNNMETDNDLKSRQDTLNDWLQKLGILKGVDYYNLRKDICYLVKHSTVYALART
jgi:hypothetical protein